MTIDKPESKFSINLNASVKTNNICLAKKNVSSNTKLKTQK